MGLPIPNSNYPGAIDDYTALMASEVQPLLTNKSLHMRRGLAGVSAIQFTLGVNPQGAAADVTERFDTIETALGTIETALGTIETALGTFVLKTGDTMTGNLNFDASGGAISIVQTAGDHRLVVLNNAGGEGIELSARGASVRAFNTGNPELLLSATGASLDMGGSHGSSWVLEGQTNSRISQNWDLVNGIRIINGNGSKIEVTTPDISLVSTLTIHLSAPNRVISDSDIQITDTSKGIVMQSRTGTGKKFRIYIANDNGDLAVEQTN